MQLHDLKPNKRNKSRKRVGRGGKRGTYSGRGQKGQKSRAGSSMRGDFRGGNEPIWKLFSKQRGVGGKVEKKQRRRKVRRAKPLAINVGRLNDKFKEGDLVTPSVLVSLGLVKKAKAGVKILGEGNLTKKLNFTGVGVSNSAKDKILKTGGTVK